MGANDVKVKFTGDTAGLSGKISAIKGQIGNLAGALGAGIGVAGFVAFTKSLIALGDEIDKGSQRIQVSREEYQKLTRAADIAGSAITTVEKAFKTVTNVVDDAGLGLETAEEMLARLGVSFESLRNKSSIERFREIAAALNEITNEGERAALANDLFGRGGQELMPLINAYDGLTDSVSTMSDGAIQASADLVDSITRMQAALASMAADTGFIGYLRDISEELENIVNLDDKISKADVNTTMRGGFGGYLDDLLERMGQQRVFNKRGTTSGGGVMLQMGPADLKKGQDEKRAREEEKTTREEVRSAQDLKTINDAVNAEQAKADKQREKEAIAQEKIAKKLRESIGDLEDKARWQKMINEGKAKEAALEKAISSATRKAGRTLTADESARVTAAATSIFESGRGEQGGRSQRGAPEISDSMLRVGAMFGGGAKDQAKAALDRKRNELLVTAADSLVTIANVQQDGTLP